MKKVLIIGAGFLQDFVIQKAKSLGYIALAVDGNPNAIGFQHADRYAVIDIVNEEACLAYAKQEKIDGVLTASTDYGVLTAAYIAQEMRLPGLNYEVAKLIKNKYRVRRCLYQCHADDTEQAFEVNSKTNLCELSYKLSFPVIVKPCDGSGSRGTSRVDNIDQFEEACKFAMESSLSQKAIVETFILGKEYGAESIVIDGKTHVLGIMKKWMTKPPYYAELGHAMPSGLSMEIEMRVKKCVEKAIEGLGINFGSVNMDLIITENGKIHIIDIGARMGGNMIGPCIIPYGTGIDYMANMIRNAVGDSVELVSVKQNAVATRLLAFDSGVIKTLPKFEELEKSYGVEIYQHMEIGQQVKEYHTNLDGCGYIVARADKVEVAISTVDMVLEDIRNTVFID